MLFGTSRELLVSVALATAAASLSRKGITSACDACRLFSELRANLKLATADTVRVHVIGKLGFFRKSKARFVLDLETVPQWRDMNLCCWERKKETV